MSILTRWRQAYSIPDNLRALQEQYATSIENFVEEQDAPQIVQIEQLQLQVNQLTAIVEAISVQFVQLQALVGNLQANLTAQQNLPTTTVAPQTTGAPTTTSAPTTTEAPSAPTTNSPITTSAPTTRSPNQGTPQTTRAPEEQIEDEDDRRIDDFEVV